MNNLELFVMIAGRFVLIAGPIAIVWYWVLVKRSK